MTCHDVRDRIADWQPEPYKQPPHRHGPWCVGCCHLAVRHFHCPSTSGDPNVGSATRAPHTAGTSPA